MGSRGTVVGLISDTHGLLRPEALDALAGSDRIVHAGDVGDPAILERLARIAPLTVVRGNVDTAEWALTLPDTAELVVDGTVRLHVLHDRAALALDPARAGIAAVISGHSHKPALEHRDGVLFVNPGSAGRRRFSLPVSLGRLSVRNGAVTVELVTLDPAPR